MTAIIDYGVGNLFSLVSSLEKIGEDVVVTKDEETIKKAERIILPGVGAFCDAMEKLKSSGLIPVISERAEKGIPILGICLGMQLLFEKSYEYGTHEGLGFLKGEIMPIKDENFPYKVPHMGWNRLILKNAGHPLYKYIENGDYVYFVHSYYAAKCEDCVIAATEYGKILTASVAKGNIMGCQFHPEKSGDIGLNILKAFCEMKEGAVC